MRATERSGNESAKSSYSSCPMPTLKHGNSFWVTIFPERYLNSSPLCSGRGVTDLDPSNCARVFFV